MVKMLSQKIKKTGDFVSKTFQELYEDDAELLALTVY